MKTDLQRRPIKMKRNQQKRPIYKECDLQKRLTCMSQRPGDSVFLLETQVHMHKRDQYSWKETCKRDLHVWTEDLVTLSSCSKRKYIWTKKQKRDLQKVSLCMKKDLHMMNKRNLLTLSLCSSRRVNYIHEKRPTKETYKRDLQTSKETNKRDSPFVLGTQVGIVT